MEIDWTKLAERAIDVRERSYSPYSKFAVGAALLDQTGKVFVGCNVENASYGLAICAERSAMVSAISSGCANPVAIVIAADPLAPPCGACRQFLVEFGNDQFMVRSVSAADPTQFQTWTATELLPDRFEF
ncbi:MAG: cytidine deaminase [Pirellulaceae bacterium]